MLELRRVGVRHDFGHALHVSFPFASQDQALQVILGEGKDDAGLRVKVRAKRLAELLESTCMFDLHRPDSAYALAILAAHPETTQVLLAQNWGGYFHKPRPKYTPSDDEKLIQFANRIHAMHKALFIIADIPQYDFSPSDMAARTMLIAPRHMGDGWSDGRQSAVDYDNRLGEINRHLRDICGTTGAVFVPLQLAFKNGNDYVSLTPHAEQLVSLYRDNGHLNKLGSLTAADFLLTYLLPHPVKSAISQLPGREGVDERVHR